MTLGGYLTLNQYNFILSAAAPQIGGNFGTSNGMIITNGTGELRKMFAATGSHLFPVGENTGVVEYTPITITFIGGNFSPGAYAGVRVINTKHPNITNTTYYLNRYWNINVSGISAPNYNVTAQYLAADVVANEANIAVGKYNGASWSKSGAVSSAAKTITFSGKTDVGLVSLSGVTLLDCSPPAITLQPVNTVFCRNKLSATF